VKVGFTGTRRGMTVPQLEAVRRLLEELRPAVFLTGCALGADDQATCIAGSLPGAHVHIRGLPSNLPGWTSEECLSVCDEADPPAPPLERNRRIVAGCDVLLACPETAEEVLRSGTWACVRAARKAGKPVRLVLPDGTVREEGGEGGH
jgi:hypothetical protein